MKKTLYSIIIVLLITLSIFLYKEDIMFMMSKNIEISENIIINKNGKYKLSGDIVNSNIVIDVNKDVHLLFDNVNINSSEIPIQVKKAKRVIIYLKNNSNNYISSDKDGILSNSKLIIKGRGSLNFNAGENSIDADDIEINNSSLNLKSLKNGIVSHNDIIINKANINIESSKKGIKCDNNLIINDGVYYINSVDDSIHSNNDLTINNGTINLMSGDDAIHSNNDLVLNNVNLSIIKSYEGIEGGHVLINDGYYIINSDDDGINATYGKRGNDKNIKTDRNKIIINSGNILIKSLGDGLDSGGDGENICEGDIEINGGNIMIHTLPIEGVGSFDFNGNLIINGGNIAGNHNDKTVFFNTQKNDLSSVYSLLVKFDYSLEVYDFISVKDDLDNEILNYTVLNESSSFIFISEKFKLNNTYNVYLNNRLLYSYTINGRNYFQMLNL